MKSIPPIDNRQSEIVNGFTLIEIMVVVVILGILAAIVVPKIMNRPEQAKEVKAKQDIMSISEALDLYNLDNGQYPTTDQGLMALVKKPTSNPIPSHWRTGGYLKMMPEDPWGRAYQYLIPGQHGEYDVFTYGKNGQAGGTGENAEIGNWQTSKS